MEGRYASCGLCGQFETRGVLNDREEFSGSGVGGNS